MESLLIITRDFEEDVLTRQEVARWLSSEYEHWFWCHIYTTDLTLVLTGGCLRSFKDYGDALASQNYTKASTNNPAALRMGPTTREGILIKRSDAYTTVGAWNDALQDANEASSPFLPLRQRVSNKTCQETIRLRTLSSTIHESDGDAATEPARHDEATILHANATLNSTTLIQLLREWAKSTLVSGSWKDALDAAVNVSISLGSRIFFSWA